jgi:hypothetical protein
MRVTLRPSVKADFDELLGHPPQFRCQCLTAVADGQVIGIGGFVFYPDGSVMASVMMIDQARRYRIAIHRAGLMAMALARRQGFRAVYAMAEDGLAGAEAWLERLGFKAQPQLVNGRKVFRWQPAH